MQTWAAPGGQPNYYEMPRPPGVRIESPFTLGMKCWAFAYLSQMWEAVQEPLLARLRSAGLSISRLASGYAGAVPYTHTLCMEVMANCFVNASYDPSRNGTCPLKVADFKAGFAEQNIKHGGVVRYPF